jgi:hypothetical protein
MSKKRNVLKFHKQFHWNISIFIILVILIYIIFHIFSYFTKGSISIYEVKMGKIARNNHYEALAIRQETIVNSDADGYPFYYVTNGSRVGLKTNVYAIDRSGSLSGKLAGENIDVSSVSKSNLQKFSKLVSTFSDGYDNVNFKSAYTYEKDLNDQVESIYHQEAEKNLQDEIQTALKNGTYTIYNPAQTGYLLYSLDGYEGVTLDNFANVLDSGSEDKSKDLRKDDKLSSGSPVYKLITSDDWNLVMKISDSIYNEIKDKKYINIKFDYDGVSTNASCSFKDENGSKYIILSLDDSMERYASSRYVSIELLLNQKDGLKIPNSSIVKNKFYKIPKDYFFKGNNSSTLGVMSTESGDNTNGFIPLDIYYSDDNNYYVDIADLKDINEIRLPDTLKTFKLKGHEASLMGVYNVNKGYATFSYINVIYKTDDYSIIEKSSKYGITQYDHIALDGKSIKNGQIIY